MTIALLLSLIIGVVPHPSDPYYDCILVMRANGQSVLCAPGGNVIDEDKRKWTGACHAGGGSCP